MKYWGGRFVIVSEAEVVKDEDSSDVKDVAVVDADGPCPGKVSSLGSAHLNNCCG